ncbi:male-enhanced antigen 1 [Coccinella septempunctata]|uniref:male-enhanced antigen 1 n=1 Tax=Coccinella septempunctata TaxID=41139 RepID=UPI001D074A98|nr:male-enhanced antigen 1 [Coccinella septempunctata]
MVYTNPIARTDADQLFPEDPIAVFEAESANILQGGYEPLPQEPECEPYEFQNNIDDLDEGYCPLQGNDHKMDTFYYYIKNPQPPQSRVDDTISPPRKKFPQPIISKNPPTSSELPPGPSGSKINLDDEKVEEVKKIMVNINLPSSYFPEWASEVPEEQWKDFILQRLHLKKDREFTEDD